MQKWEYANCLIFNGAVHSSYVGGEKTAFIDNLAEYVRTARQDRPKGVKQLVWFEDFANQLGADGWELVGFTSRAFPFGASQAKENIGEALVQAVFKRPKA